MASFISRATGGFSPGNAVAQIASPTSDQDVFTERGSQRGGLAAPGVSSNSVYWIGQDGNVYVDGRNMGRDTGGGNAGGYSAAMGSGVARYIDDPNPGGGYNAGATPGSRVGGGGGVSPALNTAAIAGTQRSLDEIPGLLQAALEAERNSYGNTTAAFDAQEQGQRKTYDESTTTNQQNYDSNLMASIRAGIKGLSGLFSTLRGTGGGANETAQGWARDAVGEVTSNDIRMGADTQKENQMGLDGALGTFLTGLSGKRQAAEDTRINNERSISRDFLTQEQKLMQDMAGFYNQGGNEAEAVNWVNRASGLTPNISANSKAQVSKYDTTPVSVAAPELTAFGTPTQPNVTSINPENGQLGAGIFSVDGQRKRQQMQPAVA